MDDADGYAAVCAIIPRKSGRVIALPETNGQSLRDMLNEDNDICQVVWTVKPGDIIAPPTHLGERMGFVIVHGASYRSTLQGADRAAKNLSCGIQVAT